MSEEPIRRRARSSVLQELADRIKQVYYDERQFWRARKGMGSESYRNTEGHDKWAANWVAAAEFMLGHDIEDYHGFIHQVFVDRGQASCCPTPMQCYGPVAMSRWESNILSRGDQIAHLKQSLSFHQHRYRSELAKIGGLARESDWPEYQVNSYIIADTSNELTALFRYSLAEKLGRPKLGEPFHEAALLQYLFGRKAYDEAWAEIVPASLVSEAGAVSASLRVKGSGYGQKK